MTSDIDHEPIFFGKFRGKTPEEIAEIAPSYLVWMYDNVQPTPCSAALAKSCRDEINDLADDRWDERWGE